MGGAGEEADDRRSALSDWVPPGAVDPELAEGTSDTTVVAGGRINVRRSQRRGFLVAGAVVLVAGCVFAVLAARSHVTHRSAAAVQLNDAARRSLSYVSYRVNISGSAISNSDAGHYEVDGAERAHFTPALPGQAYEYVLFDSTSYLRERSGRWIAYDRGQQASSRQGDPLLRLLADVSDVRDSNGFEHIAYDTADGSHEEADITLRDGLVHEVRVTQATGLAVWAFDSYGAAHVTAPDVSLVDHPTNPPPRCLAPGQQDPVIVCVNS